MVKFKRWKICGIKSEQKDGRKRFFMAKYPLNEGRFFTWVGEIIITYVCSDFHETPVGTQHNNMPQKAVRTLSEETHLLITMEDLIAMSFGTDEVNVVNLKLIEKILVILASRLRLMEQKVEIRNDAAAADHD